MCGRFALMLPPEAMEALFAAEAGALPPGPRFNIGPTQAIAVVTSTEGERHIGAMRWGLLPRWYKAPNDGPLLINARAESVAEKPAFRDAVRVRRCLVPASGFYEWEKGEKGEKLPWYIYPAAGEVLALAGIWQNWRGPGGEEEITCAILTTDASPEIAHVHHRMPVIIGENDYALWLGEAGKGAAALMQPAAAGSLALHRVSTKVNAMRYDEPALIEPC